MRFDPIFPVTEAPTEVVLVKVPGYSKEPAELHSHCATVRPCEISKTEDVIT
jgi:hypothetical protein